MAWIEKIVNDVSIRYQVCSKCSSEDCCTRYSLGIYAGVYCEECWEKSGYRKEGYEGYDYLDAGEYYGEEDY